MSLAGRFNKFLSNIQLSEKQRENAKTKYDGVCKKLHDNYYESTYDGSTKLLVGSYGKRTAIAPPTDVDVLFKMPYSEYKRYDSYVGNGQSQLLQDIKKTLLSKYPSTKIRGDGQVVVIDFISYNVELVPTFDLVGSLYIPNTNNGGSWKQTNPKSEMENLNTSNKRSNGNTIKLIKMMKAWKSYCQVPIKSLVIELSVVKFLGSWEHYNKSSIYYDWMIRDYLQYLLHNVNHSEFIPGVLELLDYGDKWKFKANEALDHINEAIKDDGEGYDHLASSELKEIFGYRFPSP